MYLLVDVFCRTVKGFELFELHRTHTRAIITNFSLINDNFLLDYHSSSSTSTFGSICQTDYWDFRLRTPTIFFNKLVVLSLPSRR